MASQNNRPSRRGPQQPNGPKPVNLRDPDPSQNALKHGLRALRPLTEEEVTRTDRVMDGWVKEMGGDCCHVDLALIRLAAASMNRVERCREAEESARKRLAREAHARHVEDLRHKARKRAQSFERNPQSTLDHMESTAIGVEWLIGRWKYLDRWLHQGLTLQEDHIDLIMHLQGLHSVFPAPDAPPEVRLLWAVLLKAFRPKLDFRNPTDDDRRYLGGFVAPPESPTTDIEARSFLRPIVSKKLEELQALLDRRHAEETAADAHPDFMKEAVSDPGPEGELRRRHERDAERTARKSLEFLRTIRHDRWKEEELQVRKAEISYEAARRRGEHQPPRPSTAITEFLQRNAGPPRDQLDANRPTPTPSANPTPTPEAAPASAPQSPSSPPSPPKTPPYPPQTNPNRPEGPQNRPSPIPFDPDPGR